MLCCPSNDLCIVAINDAAADWGNEYILLCCSTGKQRLEDDPCEKGRTKRCMFEPSGDVQRYEVFIAAAQDYGRAGDYQYYSGYYSGYDYQYGELVNFIVIYCNSTIP